MDRISIPVSQPQNAGILGPATTYFGSCGRARITVATGITCIGKFEPPACERCLTGFQAPDCVNCVADYYPSGRCDTFCQPRNDALGHFTCNSIGGKVCLPRYTDPDTNCTTCLGNFQEPDCVQCDPKFQGANCDTCIENYYPQGICDTECTPRDDALGHFTCNSLGEKVCLPRYTDPDTNCATCLGNFQEPDCVQCDPKVTCDTCVPTYFPRGRCDVRCVPQDDSTGHFTCNSVTGVKECLEGFTNPSTNCVDVNPGGM